MIVLLPMPPSTNNLFINIPKRGRVPSSQYKAWKNAAGLTLNIQRPEKFTGAVDVRVGIPKRTRGDIDNRVKALLDLLVAHGVIEDDKHVQNLTVGRDELLELGRVEVGVCASQTRRAA
jgi:crossover junction endodeoxyribonuclease RusA